MKLSRKKRRRQALARERNAKSLAKRANRKREEIVRRLQDPMTVLENMLARHGVEHTEAVAMIVLGLAGK